ncbi:DUF4249 domain-containing protein [Hymenobacter rubripertinctus]|uniref:DUF4249 domain-containing protein n=2 Tax=Hymenobacter rubripertinctus TaxID=2029981 RepID=A0A418QY31_9BACT|nr:DUF4249 domain-containing protein [Hymenobacter rubripertinctus]
MSLVFHRLSWLGVLVLAWLAGSCVEPYAPAIVSAPPSYLVVDGFLNARGSTTIRLSRTTAVASKTAPPAETKAKLFIEQENGPRYPLAETAAGTYVSATLTFDAARRYRLLIATQRGQDYASDFVAVKLSVPVDEVSWKPETDGVRVFVSTHDDTRASQYYRWEYEQTWEIRPPYQPLIEYDNALNELRDIRVRYPLSCWVSDQSNRILISKTTPLAKDVVSNFRVQTLSPDSPLLAVRYSILVRQHVLTQAEYGYWELLRRNTESIGTLFDPQPAQVVGNISNLRNPDDLALGFVGAHSTTEQRLFIAQPELPRGWGRRSGYESCVPPDTVYVTPPKTELADVPAKLKSSFGNPGFLPIDRVYSDMGVVIAYIAKAKDCVDCRERGSAVRPSFW